MPASAETFQRARRPEQKLQRRDDILGAARELALRDGVRAVSLADIAARVGIHKSALLRYFETREQIFLELTAAAWRDWVQALHAGLDDAARPGRSGRAGPGLVADVFARSFGDRPLLLRPDRAHAAQPGAQRLAGGRAPLQADLAGRRPRGGRASCGGRCPA